MAPPEDPKKARIARVRGLLEKTLARQQARLREPPRPAPEASSSPLPGITEETPLGPLHRITTYLPPDHCHGEVPIRGALEVRAEAIAKLALAPELSQIDPSRVLLLDTETTGLAGGTGTIPFLVGLAWFEEGALRVEQLLVRSPGQERPMLARLAERVRQASCLVTYNGKSYDWPLLRSRFVLNRVPACLPAAHLDLLHASRRVFKRRLRQVRLVHMEREVLGMHREHDIDGAEIPELYFRTLRGDPPSLLCPVIEHNLHDLVALAAILARLSQSFVELHREQDPRDHLGLAETAARAKDEVTALLFAEAAAVGGGAAATTVEALWLAAELARRRGEHREQRRQLLRALPFAEEPSFSPALRGRLHLALSKLEEHRFKDLDSALAHARQIGPAEGEEALARRLARLKKKKSSEKTG